MKKILLVCNKSFYSYIPKIKKELEIMGYEVILPSLYNLLLNEESLLQKKDEFKNINLDIMEKVKNTDATLVLNFDKTKNECCSINNIRVNLPKKHPNYIGPTMLLCMYNTYLNENKIFIYNQIPTEMFYEEIRGMNAIPLNGNLFNIENNYEKFKNNNLLNYFTKEQLINIEKIEDLYARAFVIAYMLFKDKKDKASKPYFDHLFRVSMRLDNNIEQVSALLHDTIEDTEVTLKDLYEIGFPLEVLEVVKLVTKSKIDKTNMSKEEVLALYNKEIENIINSNNIHAIRLKEADMTDNYNKERLKELPLEKQEWFEEKYGKNLIKLRKIKGGKYDRY